jgi:branched-chain amino acid transport system ATP-binding protein
VFEVKDIDVFYGDAGALYGLSLQVREREVVTLVGANGAGKTTALRAISGLRPVARGDIVFEGRSLLGVPGTAGPSSASRWCPRAGSCGRSSPSARTSSSVPTARPPAGTSRSRWNACTSCSPGIRERSHQLAGSMSGGEQQMVAIARALMTRPCLLMLDEPSLGLAPVVVSQVFDTIRRLHAEGLTILLVEQNLKKALEMADRGYVVETGSISIEGTAADLLADSTIRSAYLGV